MLSQGNFSSKVFISAHISPEKHLMNMSTVGQTVMGHGREVVTSGEFMLRFSL